VLLKALLVVGLALLLLRLAQTGRPWWVAVVSIALSLLAMSSRLLLQPAILSYFFLTLTLWFLRDRPASSGAAAGGDLNRENREPEAPARGASPALQAPQSGRHPMAPWLAGSLPPWPMLVLFALWVNIDGAFLLGLGVVALVGLGRSLDEKAFPLRRLYAFALLVAVCLLNPVHVHVFTSSWALAWLGWGQGTSPFQPAYLGQVGSSPAGLAYYPLLGLGLLAFLLNLPRWPWSWFLPWLALAGLSALRVRLVPFFAVVAGPVLAWELQAFFARRLETAGSGRQAMGRKERLLTVLLSAARCLLPTVVGLTFLVCAWPGWLRSPPYGPPCWTIEASPSVQRGALETARWYREGKLNPEGRGLHLSAESARVFAWFCPEDKGVLDADLAAALRGDPGAPRDWRARMRAAKIDHVIVYDTSGSRLFAALSRLLVDPDQWPLLYLEGDLAVFGWNDPARPTLSKRFAGLRLDYERLAFQPTAAQKAPPKPAKEAPQPRQWWDAFWKSPPPRSLDRDAASFYLFYAEALRLTARQRHGAAWQASQLTGLVGVVGGMGTPAQLAGPACLTEARLRLTFFQPLLPAKGASPDSLPALDQQALAFVPLFVQQRDDMPSALLLLAIRAARRVLADNPQDAQAYLILGECYLRLLHNTRERLWSPYVQQLLQLRRAQASAALNEAVALKPDLAQAHLYLSGLYREMRYFDLRLKHLRAYRDAAHQSGPPPGVSIEQFLQQQADVDQQIQQLTDGLEQLQKRYADEGKGRRPLDRALLALDYGLAGTARDLLLSSDIAAFGPRGMSLELELQLGTGRAREVWEWTSLPEQRDVQRKELGPARYHWLRARALAALGNYALAEEELRRLAPGGLAHTASAPGTMAATLLGRELLDEQPVGASLAALAWHAVLRAEFTDAVARIVQGLRQEADVRVLRGLLALERGDVDQARNAFRLALAIWKDQAAADSGAGLDFAFRPVAQGYLEKLK
jgi:hypothetical protein